MTAPSLNVYSMDEDESKRIIVHKDLSQSCSTNDDELKKIIVNENLSQNYSVNVDELYSTEKDISEYTITEQTEVYYEESMVTK